MTDPVTLMDLKASVQHFIRDKRWFGSKGRTILRIEVECFAPFGNLHYLSVFQIYYSDHVSERYFIPFTTNRQGDSFISIRIGGVERRLYDATDDPDFVLSLVDLVTESRELSLSGVAIRGERNSFLKTAIKADRTIRKITAEQSNTSIVVGNRLIIKIYRKLTDFDNPDVVIPTTLWEKTDFRDTPMPVGKLELIGHDKILIASVSQYLDGSIDGWIRFVTYLSHAIGMSSAAGDLLLLDDAEKLGSLTGRMHMALQSITTGKRNLFSTYAYESMIPGIRENIDDISRALSSGADLTDDNYSKIERLISGKNKIIHSCEQEIEKFQDQPMMIVHGDFHLGQVLFREGSYYVIDFEGEPMRRSGTNFVYSLPYKDIAGMIRSFDYSLAFSSRSSGIWIPDENREKWLERMSDSFLTAYSSHYQGEVDAELLHVFLTEKSIYELKYELNNRPTWVDIPLVFLSHLEVS